jgi:hypothetical protein
VSVYHCTTFGSRNFADTENEGTERSFKDAVAEWVTTLDGEIGVWKFAEIEGAKTTTTMVVAFYSRLTLGEKMRANETVIGFWTVTSEWVNTKCCTCGCGESCDTCGCCCETCSECHDCKCCCEHAE